MTCVRHPSQDHEAQDSNPNSWDCECDFSITTSKQGKKRFSFENKR
jgi:hypothetical protein